MVSEAAAPTQSTDALIIRLVEPLGATDEMVVSVDREADDDVAVSPSRSFPRLLGHRWGGDERGIDVCQLCLKLQDEGGVGGGLLQYHPPAKVLHE